MAIIDEDSMSFERDVSLCAATVEILRKLSERDHVSLTTELEMLISNEWKLREGLNEQMKKS